MILDLAVTTIVNGELGRAPLGAASAADLTALDGRVTTLETRVDTLTTSEVVEGANLYFTEGRARAALLATAPITYDAGTGAIGANAASANTPDYLVQRDGAGAFSAGAVTVTDLTDSALNEGSVLFADIDGKLSQDNANFFWDQATTTLKLEQPIANNTSLQMTKPEHSSALASAFRLLDSTGQESVGFTPWNGGGGTGGWGVILVGGTATGAGQYYGAVAGRENASGYRIAQMIMLSGAATDSGQIKFELGTGGGGFVQSLLLDEFGRAGFNGVTGPTAQVHLNAADGTASSAPLKFEPGTLLATEENGALEYDGSKLYITSGGVRSELTTGAAYVHPNHSGDVTSVADGAQTIAAGAVTYAKMQDVSAISKLLGRGSAAGVGDVEEITLGTNLSMSGTTLNASGGGGSSATTVETDFGSTAQFTGKFTITDAAITGTSKVLCWQAPGPYTGKGTRADEAELQPVLVMSVEPGTGSAVVKWQTPPMIIMQPSPKMGGGTATSIPKDPQAVTSAQASRRGKARGNVKFSYMVLS
jgi:Repeat of unknown function (DUF5907)